MINEAVLVSAIVPAFKTELYLDTFLEKISEQTIFPKLEVVLDLNLPSATELEIVNRHKRKLGKHLIVLINNELRSISSSMNHAIQHSTGKYIAIWNVDDLRTPESLESQSRALDSDEGATCAIGTYQKVATFGVTNGSIVRELDLSPATVLSGMHLGPFLMFPRKVLKKIGLFDEQLKSGGDFDFAIRLARAGRIVSTECLLGWYLDAGLGASTRPNSLQPVERTVIELRYGIFEKIDPKFIPAIYSYSIPTLLFNGNFNSVDSCFEDYRDYMKSKLQSFLSDTSLSNSRRQDRTVSRLVRLLKRIFRGPKKPRITILFRHRSPK